MRLVLPWPPTVNSLHTVSRGRKILSSRGRAYEEAVAWAVRSLRLEPMEGPVRVAMDFRPPDRRRRDLDNVQKAVLDALTKGLLWRDDSQIRRIEATMLEPCKPGSVEMEVTEWSRD